MASSNEALNPDTTTTTTAKGEAQPQQQKPSQDPGGQPPQGDPHLASASNGPPPPPPQQQEVMVALQPLGGINETDSTCFDAIMRTEKNRFFYEDEVFCFDKHDRLCFGLVMETYDASYSDSEQSDVEDTLKQGEVRVAWHPRGVEEVLLECGLGLADRTLMPGDVVRRIVPGQQTQKGYCREVHVSADLNVKGTACMLRNVSADRLRSLQATVRDNAVCLDSWVGSSKVVDLKLVLRTPCGSLLELRPDQEYTRLCDADALNRKGFFANAAFYVGQTLVGTAHVLERESVKWLDEFGLREVRNTKGKIPFTVVNVEIEGIMVQWKCKALSGVGDANELELMNEHLQPKSYVAGADLQRLRRLNIFESCMLQINDKNYLTIEASDVANATKKSAWRRDCAVACAKVENHNPRQAAVPEESRKIPPVTFTLSGFSCPNVPTVSVTKVPGNDVDRETANGNTEETYADAATGAPPACLARDADDSDGWITDDEQPSDLLYAGEIADQMGSMDSVNSSSCSTPTPRNSPKRSPQLLRNMKRMQIRRQQRSNKVNAAAAFDIAQMAGKELVVETRVVYSTATVVWQDGTIESGISSRQLYPIHHLDEHEFFPGDFVLSGENMSYRHYGVVQRVDYVGRTAVVKWFSTYSSVGEPIPIYFNETEVSVYDLKDHPDFQFRPGTIVIRVANFVGEDASCTAGQVVDNFAEGRVKVWWVDGHYSMCWPQDLFEVGNYDSDHNYWTSGDEEEEDEDGASDNGSWETDSADSPPGTPTTKAAAIDLNAEWNADNEDAMMRNVVEHGQPYMRTLERLMHAIEHLQEIFCANPKLENVVAMWKLLEVYKKCRFIDRLMETAFFHEDRFTGLIERVKRTATATPPHASAATAAAAAAASACPTTPTTANATIMPAMATITTPPAITRAINHKMRLFGELPPGPMTVPVLSPPAQHPLKMPPTSPSSALHIKSSIKQKQYKMSRPEICVEMPDTQLNDDDPVDHHALLLNDSGSCASADAVDGVGGKAPNRGATTKQQHTISQQLSLDLTNRSNNDSGVQSKYGDAASGEASPFNSSRYSSNTSHCSNSSSIDKPGDENTTHSCSSSSINNGNTHDDGTTASAETTETGVHTADDGCSPANDDVSADECNGLCGGGGGAASAAADEELSEYACARLCTLLKKQMRAALCEISDRHYKMRFAHIIEARAALQAHIPTSASNHDAIPLDRSSSPSPSVQNGSESNAPAAESFAATEATQTSTTAPEKADDATPKMTDALPAPMPAPPPLDCFAVLETAPSSHFYSKAQFEPVNPGQFYRSIAFDHTLLQSSLPPGVWVRAYEDRIDLLSVMIAGPVHTPYEDGMFLFDVQLSKEYPRMPPLFHYISFCADRLNPNLYEDGKVCVSLLGTWSGKGSEVWGPNSTLLQVIVSIQGLILVIEPYYNEAGYEKQKGSQQGQENSRMYNEMVIIKLVQSMTKMLQQPGETFRDVIVKHFSERGRPMYERLRGWLNASNAAPHSNDGHEPQAAAIGAGVEVPQFPLVPASRGFCLTLAGLLDTFRERVETLVNVA